MSVGDGLRAAIAPFRPRLRPSLLIVGAQKAGTSALFNMLAGHPSVIAPKVKELNFFSNDDRYAEGIGTYWRQFPLRPFRSGKWRTLEASPSYLFHATAPARIHAHLPQAWIAVILRDPVRRAFSAWNMYRQFDTHPRFAHLHDPRTFEQAVDDELQGRKGQRNYNYLAEGVYAPLLERYFSHFGRDRVLVLDHRSLKGDPLTCVNNICTAWGLDRYSGGEAVLRVNKNKRPYHQTLPEGVEQQLKTYFAPHRAALDRLLGSHLDLDERP